MSNERLRISWLRLNVCVVTMKGIRAEPSQRAGCHVPGADEEAEEPEAEAAEASGKTRHNPLSQAEWRRRSSNMVKAYGHFA